MSLIRRRRVRGSPERNVIQRPELLRRIAERMGIRQAHITPTIGDNVQPVVIVDDITREQPAERSYQTAVATGSRTPDALSNPWMGVYNETQAELSAQDSALAPDLRRREHAVRLDRLTIGNITTSGVAGIAGNLNVVAIEKGRFVGAPNPGESGVPFMDPRYGLFKPSTCTARVGTSAFIPGGQVIAFLDTGNNQTLLYPFPPGVFLPPGFTLWVFCTVNNYDWDCVLEIGGIPQVSG